MDVTYKALVSSTDYGVGKSVAALGLTEVVDGDILSFDFELGQDYYVVDKKEQADAKKLLFFVHRVKAPTLYEVQFLLAKIANPDTPGNKLIVARKPLDVYQLSEPVKKLSSDIGSKKLIVKGIIVDTVTRLCEQTANRIFEFYSEKYGADKVERMTQLLWGKIKDDLSETLYDIIDLKLHMVMTCWSKARFDAETRQSTKDLISDVLKNVRAFPDIELMLEPNPRGKDGLAVAPRAKVVKSRIRNLPAGATIKEFSWPHLLSYTPRLDDDVEVPNEQPST